MPDATVPCANVQWVDEYPSTTVAMNIESSILVSSDEEHYRRAADAADDGARRVLRLRRLREKSEAAGNTVRVAQLDWCLSWSAYKRFTEHSGNDSND